MKKNIFLLMFLVVISMVVSAKGPDFDNGYLELNTKGLRCGEVTIVPQLESNHFYSVQVRSQLFYEALLGNAVVPGKTLSSWVDVPVYGLRVGYDWAGPRPSSRYRVFCRIQDSHGNWRNADCSKVIKLNRKQHNRGCWPTALGGAPYKPLNLYRGAKMHK